jgi:putative endonuclease
MKAKNKYYFYLLKCRDGSLYSGIAKDLKAREKLHNAGKGSIYVRTHGGGQIIYSETHKNLSAALKREIQIKKWTRKEKLTLARLRLRNTRKN